MSKHTITRCDICGAEITGQVSHASYRAYLPNVGLAGEKMDLCADHAAEVYSAIETIKRGAWGEPDARRN